MRETTTPAASAPESHATKEHTMTTTTLPAVHAFTASAESRTRCECGKSRNTTAHGYTAKRSAAAAKAETATAKQDALREKAQRIASSADAIEAQVAERIATAKAAAAATPEDLPEFYGKPIDTPAGHRWMGEAVVAAISPATAKGTTHTEDGAVILPSGLVEGSPEADAAEAEESARLDAELGITPRTLGETVQDEVAAAIAAAKAEIESHVPTTPKAKAKGGKAATETERHISLWVARNMVEGLIALSSSEDAHRASIGAKVDASTPNNRGGRTIRLTEAELRTLREVATEVENAATEAKDGTVAMSATKLRGRLDGYLATY